MLWSHPTDTTDTNNDYLMRSILIITCCIHNIRSVVNIYGMVTPTRYKLTDTNNDYLMRSILIITCCIHNIRSVVNIYGMVTPTDTTDHKQ